MRAAIVEEVGRPPVAAEKPAPDSTEGMVLVEVTAAPINPIDLSIAAGTFYTGPPPVPYVPGKEGFGRVLEAATFAKGTRVWFMAPGGHGGDGSMAEQALVPEAGVVAIEDDLPDSLAACLGVAGLAGWLPLSWRAKLEPGETVLVLGASGAVGQISIQAAKLLGAGRVVAAARSAEGLRRALELGADATVDLSAYPDSDSLAAAFIEAGGGPINVTVDPLWGDPMVAAAKASAFNARIVALGQSAGATANLPSAAVRGKLLSILGHTNFAAPPDVVAETIRRMTSHAAAGELVVDFDELPLSEVTSAWKRQAEFPGRKLVLIP